MNHFIKAIAILLFSASSLAADTDELVINSQNQDLNYKANTLYFSGQVVIKQGALLIEADDLFVETNSDGDTESLIAKGKPAKFSRQLEDGSTVTASADEITYQVNIGQLELKGTAKLTQGGSIVSSSSIVFDLNNQRVQAQSGDGEDDRVTTRLKIKREPQNND